MTRLSRLFLVVLFALAGGFAVILIDGMTGAPTSAAANVVSLVGLPGVAYSAHYFEDRCRDYADFSTTVHPDLPPPSILDFTYGR